MTENIRDTLKKLNIHCPRCNSKNYYRYKNGELRCQRCSFVYNKDSAVKLDFSDIKTVSNIHCPRCNSKNYYRYKNGSLRCQRCSFVYNDTSIKDVPINNKEQIEESNAVTIGHIRKPKWEKWENAKTNKEYIEGYIDGFKLALEMVGGDLCEEPVEGYALADYGNDYMSHAEFIETKDCLNCKEPGKDECAELGVLYCPLYDEEFDDLVETNKEHLKGFILGFRRALYEVGLEIAEGVLCDDPEDEYNFAEYGKNYISHAEFIGITDCLNCKGYAKDECSELGRLCPIICF